MSAEAAGRLLAAVNAGLNAASLILLLAGFREIRRGEIDRHRRRMIGAVSASALFLVLYVVRFALTGTHAFPGPDSVRPLYLAVLFSHMFLAMALVPMVARTLFLARRRRFAPHRRLARWTFPTWVYVSLGGLAVYFALYHVWA